MAKIKDDLLYYKTYHWVKKESDDIYTIGITDYFQEYLGTIQYVELPSVGENIFQNQEYASIVSEDKEKELLAPLSGNVVEVNEEVSITPEIINESPYKAGWLIKIRISDESELSNLLSPEEYRDLIYENKKMELENEE